MKRSDYVSNDDVRRYGFLVKEADRLFSALKEVTPDTDQEEVVSIQKEYSDVIAEKDRLWQRISNMKAYMEWREHRIKTKATGTDMKAFDDDANEFFDSLYDYYESCKVRLRRMMRDIDGHKTGLLKCFSRWRMKRMIKRQIKEYTNRQKECSHIS